MVMPGKSEVRSQKSKVQSPQSKVNGRVWLAILVAVLAFALTCRKWDNPHDTTGNRAPTVPSHPQPDSGATGRDPGLMLAWHSQDPDSGDTVRFEVFLGVADTQLPLVKDSLSDTTFQPSGLGWSTRYYWRIVAFDNHGAVDSGPYWQFTTAAANRAPLVPYAPTPDSGVTGLFLHTVLSWKSGDPDTGDTAAYDVYFGTTNPPPLVAQGQRDSSYTPTLVYGALYYWQIKAKDNHGAESSGPLWQFSTMAVLNITAPAAGARLRMYALDTIAWTGGPGDEPAKSRGLESKVKVQKARIKTAELGTGTAGIIDAADSTIIYRSTDDGVSWTRHDRASLPGQYFWQVPGPATKLGRIRLRAFAQGDTMTAISGLFEIYDTVRPSAIVVTSPTDSSVWAIGSVHDVTWTGGTDGADSSVVYFSFNDGVTWVRQGKAAAPGVFPWAVAGPATTLAKIEVRAYNGSGTTTGTSGTFKVVESPYPDSVIAIAAVGTRPQALCYDSIDNRVFVALYKDTGSVSVVDGNTNGVIARINVGSFPCALVWNPAGNKVYVANQLGASVTVINAATNSVIRTVPAGAKPYALCHNPVNNKVYVANYNDSSVTIIGGASDSVLATVMVEPSPQAVYWNPADNKVYVANFGANSVSIIDGATNQLVQTVHTDVGPCAITAEPTYQETYIADRTAGKVTIIDAAGQVVGHVPVGLEPWAVATNPVQSRVYSSNSVGNTVTVIDASNHNTIAYVPVSQQPRTLWWAWQVGKLYVACYGGGSVAIIDGATNALLRTVTVGNKPSALCWNGPANKAYVANYDDGTVSVLGAGLKERP
jgi:YVTN family beta-propeller protein